jgi:hypothetical protein
MAFKKKPTKKIKSRMSFTDGEDIEIPRPPNRATHVLLEVKAKGKKQKAIVPIKDFDTLLGVAGKFQYIRRTKKGDEQFKIWYDWDGKEVQYNNKNRP